MGGDDYNGGSWNLKKEKERQEEMGIVSLEVWMKTGCLECCRGRARASELGG